MLIFATHALSSCAVPDPLFLQNAHKIPNTDHPRNKIVGTWVHVGVNRVRTATDATDRKTYFDIRPGGRATVREVVMNRATGSRLAAEAQSSWTYQGNNLWMIGIPPFSAFRVTDSHNMQMGRSSYRLKPSFPVRYYDGNLYDIEAMRVLVPADARRVSELANRMREVTPVIRLDQKY